MILRNKLIHDVGETAWSTMLQGIFTSDNYILNNPILHGSTAPCVDPVGRVFMTSNYDKDLYEFSDCSLSNIITTSFSALNKIDVLHITPAGKLIVSLGEYYSERSNEYSTNCKVLRFNVNENSVDEAIFNGESLIKSFSKIYNLPSGRMIAITKSQSYIDTSSTTIDIGNLAYYSDDDGRTWQSFSNQLGGRTVRCMLVTDTKVYAYYTITQYNSNIGQDQTHGYLMESTDNGNTWQLVGNAYDPVSGINTSIRPILPEKMLLAKDGSVIIKNYYGIIRQVNGPNLGERQVVLEKSLYDIIVTASGRLLGITSKGKLIYSDDNGLTWTESTTLLDNEDLAAWELQQPDVYLGLHLLLLPDESVLAQGQSCYKSSTVRKDVYDSKPITKKEAQALIDECKAYVRLKKQS